MSQADASGIVRIAGERSVDETVALLQSLLAERGITLFAMVDHSGEAAKAGLSMPPTKLLIFGNPKGGTPVMLASPNSAIDLPLKLLVAQDAGGITWISYNDPQYLQARHGIPDELAKNLVIVITLAQQAAAKRG